MRTHPASSTARTARLRAGDRSGAPRARRNSTWAIASPTSTETGARTRGDQHRREVEAATDDECGAASGAMASEVPRRCVSRRTRTGAARSRETAPQRRVQATRRDDQKRAERDDELSPAAQRGQGRRHRRRRGPRPRAPRAGSGRPRRSAATGPVRHASRPATRNTAGVRGSPPRRRTRQPSRTSCQARRRPEPTARFGVPWTQPSHGCIGRVRDRANRHGSRTAARTATPRLGGSLKYCAHVRSLHSVRQVALATGGSRGIGLMIARGFVEAGLRYISSARPGVRRGRRRTVEGGRMHQRARGPRNRAACIALAEEIGAASRPCTCS